MTLQTRWRTKYVYYAVFTAFLHARAGVEEAGADCVCLVPWHHGTVVYDGKTAPWYQGLKVHHGTIWFHGAKVPWHNGTMAPWYHGAMVP